MNNLLDTKTLQEQREDRKVIDRKNVREAAVAAALEIVTHLKDNSFIPSGETITRIIVNRFEGFTRI